MQSTSQKMKNPSVSQGVSHFEFCGHTRFRTWDPRRVKASTDLVTTSQLVSVRVTACVCVHRAR